MASQNEVHQVIIRIASEENVKLTAAAIDMLAVPLLEQFPSNHALDLAVAGPSVRKVIVSVKNEVNRVPGDTTDGKLNARAIIRGYWQKFCDIPPFCGRT